MPHRPTLDGQHLTPDELDLIKSKIESPEMFRLIAREWPP